MVAGLGQQLGHDGGALLRRLARPVHRLGESLAQHPMVVDASEAQIGERQAAQARDGVVGAEDAGADVVDQPAQRGLVHALTILPPR